MKDFISKNIRYIVIGVLFVILVIVIIAFVKKGANESADTSQDTSSLYLPETTVDVPTDDFEVDAYPTVNSLLESYLNAYAAGDADTVASLSNVLSEEERVKIQVQAKYVEGYSDYKVYTKPGPQPNSYFAFVTYNI